MSKPKSTGSFLKASTKAKKIKLPVVEENPEPINVPADTEIADLLAAAKDEPTIVETVVEAVKEVVQAVKKPVAPVTPVSASERNFTALGVYWDDTQKIYLKVTIDYNPISGYSKVVSTEKIADSPSTAIYKLNTAFSMKILKREEKV